MIHRTCYTPGAILFSFLLCMLSLGSCNSGIIDKESKAEADSARAMAVRKAHPDRKMYADQVMDAEKNMKASTKFDASVAAKAIKAYLDYASTFPDDKLAPDYYFRAAGIAVAAGNYDQGIVCYQTVVQKYPDYKFVVEAIYQEAMIYDSNLPGQDAKAKLLYEQIINDYPKHKLAEDAKIAITHLGKTDEEIVKEFEAKNKK
ncbi:MAG: tol-pal system YbgF family protein [Bacteroidia bacterium]